MKLQEIYELAIDMGIKADPRGGEKVKELLEKRKKEAKELSEKKKKFFDEETLTNPYSDSRILYGDPNTEVKKLLAGIDTEGEELLLADRMTQKGKNIDAVIGHHPSGHALAALHEVMEVQVDMYASVGVPANVAHALFSERMSWVQRRFGPLNHGQAVDTARLLDIPLIALHTIWDNMGHQFLTEYLTNKSFETAGEVLEYIQEIPEFVEATKGKAAPALVAGNKNSRAGKIVHDFTGGTNPSKELYIELAKAGVGTIIEMHVPEDAIIALRKMHVNVIDCGHMAADSIGANIFLDALEKKGVEVIPCSGLIRVKRN
ncbi:MAG TPA: hypothetical protein VLF89_09015 [Candidatus Saccharimonadales bacterium]|nr:hypothetical protein [Candidatus Saccharimonadales bacterium]